MIEGVDDAVSASVTIDAAEWLAKFSPSRDDNARCCAAGVVS
jgi:hypothetical protein